MNIPTVDATISPQVFYILLALIDKSLHGYGIRTQVAYDSQSSVVMATGTVYILLKRLVDQGLLRTVPASDNDSRITRRYELTEGGIRRLNAELKRLESMTRLARYRLAGQKQFMA